MLHRIQLHLPDDALFLLQGRVRIIKYTPYLQITLSIHTKPRDSVWHPLEHIVQDSPLAFCDPASVSDEDLVECDHIRRKYKGAHLYSYFNNAHDWRYLGQQRPEEVLLLKMFDPDTSVAARSKWTPSLTAQNNKIYVIRTPSCVIPPSFCLCKVTAPAKHWGSRFSLQLSHFIASL